MKDDYSVYETIIKKYAQEQVLVDPNQIQVGQSVYDDTGEEKVIIGNPEGTPQMVTMPAGSDPVTNPEGVEILDDVELASTYTIAPQTPTARKRPKFKPVPVLAEFLED